MKSIKFLLLFLISAISTYGQFNMPSFKDVVTTFYSKYAFDSYDNYLKFQRKKDGWYVSEDNYNNPGNFFNTKLFWSKDAKTYTELDYPMTNGDTSLVSDKVSKYLTQINWSYEEYQYLRNMYYGYPGWDWDVINEEISQSSLTDSLLESKARAYFNYASGFIGEQYGDLFVNNDNDRLPTKASNKISKSRIEKFILYELKAINAYSEILRMNPDYETRVGNIRIKLANEYMFSYLELQMAGDLVKAKEFAMKAEFPDSLLAISKSYLFALPLNSILITGGDNDTYPLWYLQKVKNFRPDITVLNYNLIGFRRYLSLLEQDKKLQLFSTSDSSYLRDDFDYFLFGNQNDNIAQLDVATFLKHLKNNYNPHDTSTTPYKGGIIKKYYAKQLYFENDSKQKSKPFNLSNFLFLNDYILLDIINTSRKKRVFFTFNIELLSTFLTQKENFYELKLANK